jgi:replicative DNA helicase
MADTSKFANPDAERSLVGATLLDPERVLPQVLAIVQANDFADKALGRVFQALVALYTTHQPIDVLTVAQQLRSTNLLDAIGGPAFLTTLPNDIAGSGHAPAHARMVADLSTRRRLLNTTDAINQAVESEQTVEGLLGKAETAILAVGKAREQGGSVVLATVLEDTYSRIDAAQNGTAPRGISTGYQEADAILTGLQPSDLIILAARPAMGKTAFALNLARSISIVQNIPCLIFSLEMSRDQLVDRLLAMETGVPTDQLRSGQLSTQEMSLVMEQMGILAQAPLYIDDTPQLTIQSLRARSRQEHHRHGIGVILIDYLQLMSGQGRSRDGNREQEISEISRGLKILARELNVPVIALSQLSRQVESREVKLPQLSDLRESGSIEQNADIVAFLYRDDYYNPDSPRMNMTDLVIRKHRNGRTGTVEFYFDRRRQRFYGVAT